MALADSMLKYGMQKIKMSQASSLGNTISKIGDLGMEAGAALTKVAKATESNRKSYETIQTGKKEVGIDDEGSFLEKTGLKSSLNSDKSFDVNTGGGSVNPRKVSYDARGLKQIGTLSSTYSSDYLIKKYGKDWEEKYGVSTNIRTPLEYREKTENFNPISQDTVNVTMASYDSRAKALESDSEPKGPSAPIDPDTGKPFMSEQEDARRGVSAARAKLGEELGDRARVLEQEEFANQLSRKLRQAAINPDYSGKFSESSDSAYKNALGINLKNTKRSPFGIKNSNSMKINNNETIDVSFDAKKIEKRDAGRKIKSKETKPLEIENKIIDDFVKDSDGIIEEDPKEISSKKYKKISEEDGLNFAASDIDKKTGKTIYNLYNREGKNLGAIFSMKDGKMTKEDKEFFKNLKHFKGLEFPDLIQKIET